jgi:glycosyltransferase involved in cell wall biosynthesis
VRIHQVMIRVVFLIRSLDPGGAERQLTTLVRAMDKDRFEVTVITFYSGGRFEKELTEGNIRLISLHKRGRWDVIRFLWRLYGEVKRLSPNILHSYLVEPNLVAVALKPLFRSMKVVWGIRASNVEFEDSDRFARSSFFLQRYLSPFADLIITNSEAGRAYHLAHGFPALKSIVIHGGVDTERFQPNRESGKPIRTAWGLNDDTVLIGLVGRLDPMKDHPTFLKAAALLAREDSALRFVCVGTGPESYRTKLRLLTDEYKIADRVIWAGAREDMPAVYNALDITCSSSCGEGLPNAISEAMACGVPCVVTNVGDSALLVGNTGIVVSPADPEALADGLSKCVDMVGAGAAPNPRRRISENFDLATLVKRTEAALAALI